MKVKIKPLRKYEVEIDGKRLEMTLESEWNGMAEFRHKGQTLIVDNNQDLVQKFLCQGIDGELDVVKISPSLCEKSK